MNRYYVESGHSSDHKVLFAVSCLFDGEWGDRSDRESLEVVNDGLAAITKAIWQVKQVIWKLSAAPDLPALDGEPFRRLKVATDDLMEAYISSREIVEDPPRDWKERAIEWAHGEVPKYSLEHFQDMFEEISPKNKRAWMDFVLGLKPNEDF